MSQSNTRDASAPDKGERGGSGPGNGDAGTSVIQACLARLSVGDASARDELVDLVCGRMQEMAHRMLGRYPVVRRYDDTDDVVQNALVRLHRALSCVFPESPERFLGLAALQLRRELTDLARKHAGPEAQAAHHETDSIRIDGEISSRVAAFAAPTDPTAALDRWTRLHEVAAELPDDQRRLFDLAWYLGLQQEDAAKILGCSLRTVKRRWEQVKASLREAIPGGPGTSLPD